MVALVDAACTDAFRASVLDAYGSATQVIPEIYPVEAAPGAEAFGTGANPRRQPARVVPL
jgi:hypothetical protein